MQGKGVSAGTRAFLGGVLLLAAMWGASTHAIHHWRRKGAMTPIEAQAMDMDLPAPYGTAPVELAPVRRGRIAQTVRYAGQAVGYVEAEVNARVEGIVKGVHVYVGEAVRPGQLLAHLDVTRSAPQTAERRAALHVAERGVAVAQGEQRQAQAVAAEAHAEAGMRQAALEAARAELEGARLSQARAQATLEAWQAQAIEVEAQLQAAQAGREYWQQELARTQKLLSGGAVTLEEYQRTLATARNAEAQVRQAEARQMQVQAQIRVAQAERQQAEAMVRAAQARVQETGAELRAHLAHVQAAQAGAVTAREKLTQARANVVQARAALTEARVIQGYSKIRAQTQGVVTQRVVSPGTLVSPGQTLLRIAQIAPIRLQAHVAEADLSRIRVGSRVRVFVRDSTRPPVQAHVTSIAPAVDPVARTGVVEAVVPNHDRRFLPGQFVTLEVTLEEKAEALYVPLRALRHRTPATGRVLSTHPGTTVWVAEPVSGEPHRYTVREVAVRVGLRDGDTIEVLSGLSAGQKVVVVGQDFLHDGDTVHDRTAPLPSPAGTQVPAGSSRTGRPVPPSGSPAVYTCPMHPEVNRQSPGDCPKCQMKLVRTRKAGRP
ncbi:MAG: efflux RND transporter periplasmic adaptor subunit [Chloroherpetonaceae bacterium]|nr:efflux RND transporter periplasmic adaptor subunit [Chthonomonadaceae bacterium]MDW8207442.1 efflux RND transporter periplasmic adaptor subunit [Chloroherpetonaceae bacterium]